MPIRRTLIYLSAVSLAVLPAVTRADVWPSPKPILTDRNTVAEESTTDSQAILSATRHLKRTPLRESGENDLYTLDEEPEEGHEDQDEEAEEAGESETSPRPRSTPGSTAMSYEEEVDSFERDQELIEDESEYEPLEEQLESSYESGHIAANENPRPRPTAASTANDSEDFDTSEDEYETSDDSEDVNDSEDESGKVNNYDGFDESEVESETANDHESENESELAINYEDIDESEDNPRPTPAVSSTYTEDPKTQDESELVIDYEDIDESEDNPQPTPAASTTYLENSESQDESDLAIDNEDTDESDDNPRPTPAASSTYLEDSEESSSFDGPEPTPAASAPIDEEGDSESDVDADLVLDVKALKTQKHEDDDGNREVNDRVRKPKRHHDRSKAQQPARDDERQSPYEVSLSDLDISELRVKRTKNDERGDSEVRSGSPYDVSLNDLDDPAFTDERETIETKDKKLHKAISDLEARRALRTADDDE